MRNPKTSEAFYSVLSSLVDRLASEVAASADVIPWSCPVPIFGNVYNSQLATLGINPSNREFVDKHGNELRGEFRRFHTLKSLGLDTWAGVDARHMERIMTTFETYFSVNPYSGWFNVLDFVIAGADASYYDATASACHLDLVPYATTKKWMHLTQNQRRALISMAGNTLGTIIRDSSVRTLVLNGRSVVKGFELATGSNLTAQEMPAWSLRSGATRRVRGIAFTGTVDRISGVNLDKKILVIGFNHNLQSSFGVTTRVLREIRHWIREIAGTRRW